MGSYTYENNLCNFGKSCKLVVLWGENNMIVKAAEPLERETDEADQSRCAILR